MTKLRNRHIRSLLVLCAAAVLLAVGSTVAFFSSRDESTNRFSSGGFDILLTETDWDPNGARNVVPGDELPKNPQVTNNAPTPGYIFFRVTVPADTLEVENDLGAPLGTASQVPMYKFMVRDGEGYAADTSYSAAQRVRSSWKSVGSPVYSASDKAYVYVYAYTAGGDALVPLAEGQTTEPLFDRLWVWNFNEGYDPEQNHSVLVEAFGIQSDLPDHTAEQIAAIWTLASGGGAG